MAKKSWKLEASNELDNLFDELMPKIKEVQFLKTKYDTSDTRLYSYDEYMLKAKIESIKARLSSGRISTKSAQAIKSFLGEARQLKKSTKEYVTGEIRERQNAFLNHLKDMGLDKDYRRAKKLLDKLTKEEKEAFFTSDKYQAPVNDYESESWLSFLEENETSVQVAKLEDWIKNNTKHTRIKSTFNAYTKVNEED